MEDALVVDGSIPDNLWDDYTSELFGGIMSKPKHTPGPWHWNEDIWDGKHPEWRYNTLYAADGEPVLEHWAHYADDAGLDVSDANASLIASAPELLEERNRYRKALKKLMNETRGVLNIDEGAMRYLISNTNYDILVQRVAEAQEALETREE